MTDQVKISGLTPSNMRALREVFAEEIETGWIVPNSGSSATFLMAAPADFVAMQMERLPVRGHPRASLHAVVRKLRKMGA